MLICSSYRECGGDFEEADWWCQSSGLQVVVKEMGWRLRRLVGRVRAVEDVGWEVEEWVGH